MKPGQTIVTPKGHHARIVWRRGAFIGVQYPSGNVRTFNRHDVSRGY